MVKKRESSTYNEIEERKRIKCDKELQQAGQKEEQGSTSTGYRKHHYRATEAPLQRH